MDRTTLRQPTAHKHSLAFSCILILLTLYTVCAFQIDLSSGVTGDGLSERLQLSVRSYSILSVIALPAVYCFYRHAILIYLKSPGSFRRGFCHIFPAVLFGLFMVFGQSFKETDSWNLIFADKLQMLKALALCIGYSILFFCCIAEIFEFCAKHSPAGTAKGCRFGVLGKYLCTLEAHPFLTTLITLLIAYIPYIILSYPAIFMGDTVRSIMQAYNLEDYWAKMLNLISEDVRINSGQPVVHTLLLRAFLELHRLFSWNIAIFIYALVQFLFLVFMMSLLIRELSDLHVSPKILACILIFYIVCPRINNYMFLVTKDVYYVSFLILYHIALFRILSKKNPGRRTYILWGISLVGIILLRNEGMYLLVLTSLGMLLFCKRIRKQTLIFLLCAVALSSVYSKVILPAFQITPASRRESLTIPFQQTARYLRDAGDEVTEEEKEAISAVLKDYDTIVDSYDPNLSDYVKDNFNESATSEDMKNYFKVWFEMFKKHPGIYIQATMNNLYQYVYPDARQTQVYSYHWSGLNMSDTNKRCADVGTEFSHPEALSSCRNYYESLREAFFRVAPFAFINSPATYVWALILWVFYCIYKKKKTSLGFCMLLIVQILICIAAPANGAYFRYLYPVAVCLPAVLLMSHSLAEKAPKTSITNAKEKC